LQEELSNYGDDEYILFDCPGQIELYSHVPVFRTFVDALKMWDFRCAAAASSRSTHIPPPSRYPRPSCEYERGLPNPLKLTLTLTLGLAPLWWCACRIAAVYLLDANFVNDGSKFIAGTMQALSAMTMLEVPHVNVRVCLFSLRSFVGPAELALALSLVVA